MNLNFDNTTLIFIGGLVVLIAGTMIRQWFTKFIDHKFDKIYAKQEQNEKEREIDNFMTMYGQQVTCDCLHHLTQAVLKGDHVEELETASTELDKYRATLNKTLLEKASRYNIQIEH